jgi:precorrin-8X/cobalt-precorrin-8 methylmutase
MVKAGINKAALAKLQTEVLCFMADEDVASAAKREGTTRAAACMNKAARLPGNPIFAVGNAPTALNRLAELIHEGLVSPSLIIGVPVGSSTLSSRKSASCRQMYPPSWHKGEKAAAMWPPALSTR